MVLDCLSPAFPKPFRVMLLASSSVLRSLCGVAAGSAKASLSAHFARWGNLGELNAVGEPKPKPNLLNANCGNAERFKPRDRHFIAWYASRMFHRQDHKYFLGHLDHIAAAVDAAPWDKLFGGEIGLHADPEPAACQYSLCLVA